MDTHGFRTLEIMFPQGEVRTDALLYREKCRLLLPEPFTQNIFTVISSQTETGFFISSDSDANLERMEAFFSRLYGTLYEEVEQPVDGFQVGITVANSALNLRRREFYHPRFVRNILDYTSVEKGSRMRYSVSIRSGRRTLRNFRKFNFSVSVGFDSPGAAGRFRDMLTDEISILKREAGHRMKTVSRPVFSDSLLSVPFNLINFVRVPSEKDLLS